MDELPNGLRAEPRPAAARPLVSEERGLAALDEADRSAEQRIALALAAALSVAAE